MTPEYVKHTKISLRKHPTLNERWLQQQIEDDPMILGLGEVRMLARERPLQGGGRLDLILVDDETNRRYEVEIQLGATDPSHIIRCIEYWDLERRKYPGYDHVAVIVAENVTTRFLNVMGLLSGSIPLIAIQLDALQFENRMLLNFVQVLDQSDLRFDDTDTGEGGQTDRAYWENKVGTGLMKLCEELISEVNGQVSNTHEPNYLKGYIGLQSNGIANNFILLAPKRTKNFTHVFFRHPNSAEWVEKFEEAGVPVRSLKKGRFRISISPKEFTENRDLVRQAIQDAVNAIQDRDAAVQD